MSARSRLFATRDPFDIAGTDALFTAAVREDAAFHYAHCPPYRRMLDARGIDPSAIASPADLPPLPTVLFKHHRLFSMDERRLPVKATSSGTRGVLSHIGLDWGALFHGAKMVLRVTKWRGLLSPVPVSYLVLGYEPHKGVDMAVMKTAFGATLLAPAIRRRYALRWRDGGYQADLAYVLDELQKLASTRFPVRFMGFPSYTYFLLREMEQRGIRVTLPKGSRIMLGGGWKAFYAEAVDKQVLYDMILDRLGVLEEDVVEFFGAVEHPILWCDCKAHRFHVPAYARAVIRDVRTLAPVPMGTPGLVSLITPMIRACPLTSVMTDDLGILHPGGDCPCGLKTPYLEILGRVGLDDIRTCAAGAAALLDTGKEGKT